MTLYVDPPALVRPAPSPTRANSTSGSFTYQPALDGVRGISLVMVLLGHARFGWMSGAAVALSIFFTLSGYLITSLAIVEFEHTGRMSLSAFYNRRIRRVLPPSLACLVGVIVAAWFGQFDGVTRLRRDLWAALLQVYNWAILTAGDSYSEEIARAAGQRSPLDHYWSLAIEEQFYWVWPLVLLVVLRFSRRGRLLAISGMLACAVFATIVIAVVSRPDALYLATPARLPEILLGALVAFALHHPKAKAILYRNGADWVAVAAIAVIGWAAVSWPIEGGPLYEGWLPLFAVASAALIVGLQVESPIRWVLSRPPLVVLGRISYGTYLYHWPVFTILDERRFHAGRAPLFAVRMAITFSLAGISYLFLERPIRRRRFASWPTFAVAASVCGLIAAAVAFMPDRGGRYSFVADETRSAAQIPLLASGEEPATLTAVGPADASGVPSELSRPARIMIVGDSTATLTGDGMIEWAAAHPDVMRVEARAAPGCGLSYSGEIVEEDPWIDRCRAFVDSLPDSVESIQPDVVVAMVTYIDIRDRIWSEDEGALASTDARYRARLVDAYDTLTRSFLDAGAEYVMWVIPPKMDLEPVGRAAQFVDDERVGTYRVVLEELATRFPERVVIADMLTWVAGQDDPPERPDGIHWSLDGAVRVTEGFLVPEIFAALIPADGAAVGR